MSTTTISDVKVTKGDTVSKPRQTSKTPLAPTEFTATLNNGELTVTVKVLIDSSFKPTKDYPPALTVDEKGTSFYVQFDQTEEIPKQLTYWTLTGTLKSNCKFGDMVTAYNQDVDPITSRGTVSTVKPPA